ncbi:Mrp/NBP35 family ATP-binding protein [Alphaproteobacteria bacterium]|nr:Mrp/NBP35 family ATP-binding protein [Alphaproteobacteria bacterium]
MANELNDIKIRDALATIFAPGADTDIVTAGAVSGIVIKDGHVGFSIEINPKDKDAAEPLKRAAEKAVLALDGVLSATALLTAHQPASSQQASPQSAQQGDHGTLQPATHVIAVASGKGGVGKSTTAINLALALAETGKKVGILDADIYGPSLPRLIGENRKPESDGKKIKPIEVWGLQTMSIGYLVAEETPTIWRGPMVMSALEQMLRDVAWHGLDILVIDMPPGTGDAQLSLSQRATLAGAVIVSTPQDLALIDARKGLNMFKKVNVPLLGIVENMSFFSCPDCGGRHNIFGNGGAEAEAKKLGVPFLGGVPLEMDIRETSDAGKPIVASSPDSPHAAHYRKIAAGVLDALNVGKAAAPHIIFE